MCNISDVPQKKLPILSNEEAGSMYNKWSYVNIYSLKDLKDIYLISLLVKNKHVKEITYKVNELKNNEEKWEERKVLEYLNSLVKFGLLDRGYKAKRSFFEDSLINNELTINDCEIFKKIFINYFRFKELSSWFISIEDDFHSRFDDLSENDLIINSRPLYFYSDKNRFTDTFLTDIDNITTRYIIEDDILMRFWDVYLKWGTSLGFLDKFNMSVIKRRININKEITVAYFIKPFQIFNLKEYINEKFNSRHILIPDLIFEIVKSHRYSINEIKTFITNEICKDDQLTYERTSEIFLIKGKNSRKKIESATYLYPKINNSYISHLILRK